MEFFGNKPFTQQPERAISQADQLLDYKSWAEGLEKGLERGLERGRAEGLERGKVEGSLSMLLNLVRQHLLTSEIASQQLGMSVAEFEALL